MASDKSRSYGDTMEAGYMKVGLFSGQRWGVNWGELGKGSEKKGSMEDGKDTDPTQTIGHSSSPCQLVPNLLDITGAAK